MRDELYHHGIKGMHWGIRRYQNPDGTYTDAGKRHEAKMDRKRAAKNASQLSDDELQARITRLQREKQLRDLTSDVVRPGRKKALDLLDRYGNQVAAAAVGAATTVYITNRINPQKSTYERKLAEAQADRRLAMEGYRSKGYDSQGNPKK